MLTHCRRYHFCLIVDAVVRYNFSDVFTDPAELRDNILQYLDKNMDSSDPDHPLFDQYKWTEFNGTFFDIVDTWQNKLSGIIKHDT